MNDILIEDKIRLFKNRFMFSRYKFHLRYLVAPFYLLFALLDYWYCPENIILWTAYRLFVVLAIWLLFIPLVKFKRHRKNIQVHLSIITVLAANMINIMIFQSGGYASKYFIGVILCAVAGIQLFKFSKLNSFIVQAFSYLPSIGILILTSPSDQLKNSIIQSLFFIGMAVLSYIFGASDEENTTMIIKIRQKMKVEIVRMNKTEMLKKFFPLIVRQQIEANIEVIEKKKKVQNVVVGFADIANSTQIANQIELDLDWTLKEKFLEAATQQALKNDMVVLTHLGDGFLFLANYVNKDIWQENFITFFQVLTKEYEKIYSSTVGISGSIESGAKFGLAKGDVMIGFLGSDQAYFTAIGPAVNLAARVCAKAERDQLVVTDKLWEELSAFKGALSWQEMGSHDLKGFAQKCNLIKISAKRKVSKHSASVCSDCFGVLKLQINDDGFMDYVCKNCENKPSSTAA